MKYLHLIVLCLILSACSLSNTNGIKLEGTRWRLQSLNGHELRANTVITLYFDAEMGYGRGGCNGYDANYTIQPNHGLKVSDGAWTEMLCSGPEGIMEQESEYESAFWNVSSYKREGTTLVLANEQKGILLKYQLIPTFKVNSSELTGKTWQLVSATGFDGVELDAVTLRFDGSKFSGTMICGPYEGIYQANGDNLRFLSLGPTIDVNCSQQDMTPGERRYTGLLGLVWQYNVSETQLELYTDNGKTLVFELAGQK